MSVVATSYNNVCKCTKRPIQYKEYNGNGYVSDLCLGHLPREALIDVITCGARDKRGVPVNKINMVCKKHGCTLTRVWH